MAGFYKSPGVYVKNVDVDYWMPTKRYSTLLRKYKINKIFNLNREIYSDTFTLINRRSSYKKTFKIPVGKANNNKPNLFKILKKYISTIKI